MIYGANVRGHAYGISNSRDILSVTVHGSKFHANFPKTCSTLAQKGKYSHQATALFLCDHKRSKLYLISFSFYGKKSNKPVESG